MIEVVRQVIGAVAFFLIAVGLAQFVISVAVGVSQTRSGRRRDEFFAAVEAGGTPLGAHLKLAYLIPCLDEALVIGTTVEHILADDPTATVMVIDDGSTDGTAEAAIEADAGRGQVMVCRRVLPEAQRGKGPALNAGLRQLKTSLDLAGEDRSSIVVCVMDADGRLSEGASRAALRLLHNDRVGAVQLPVRIRNTGTILTDYQDFEFWGLSAVQQAARARTGTVSLGGNGQFSRLSALEGLGAEPWSDSLTEDLDLAISLMADGWWLEMTPSCWVDQQAVTEVGRLLRQRTRWMQGHLTCARRIPEIWRARELSNLAVLETTNYLLVPLLLILPWSIVFTLSVNVTLGALANPPSFELFGSRALAHLAIAAAWYLSSFSPHLVSGALYHRRRDDASLGRCLLLAHGFILYNFITFISTWRAVGRLATGRDGWTKTTRSDESRRSQNIPNGAS